MLKKLLQFRSKALPSLNLPQPSNQQLFESCYRILNQSDDGSLSKYKLQIDQSKIPNSGSGVFLKDGIIKKGDIIGLYSGY